MLTKFVKMNALYMVCCKPSLLKIIPIYGLMLTTFDKRNTLYMVCSGLSLLKGIHTTWFDVEQV